MPAILLLSAVDDLRQTLADILVGVTLHHLPPNNEMPALIEASIANRERPAAILIDARQEIELVNNCRWMRQKASIADIPLLAVIVAEDRQAALQAGIDDYLLAPLLPAEVHARLLPYLDNIGQIFNVALQTVAETSSGVPFQHILDQNISRIAQAFQSPAGWLYLWDDSQSILQPVQGERQTTWPELLHQQVTDPHTAAAFVDHLKVENLVRPQVVTLPLDENERGTRSSEYLCVPLGNGHLSGLLVLQQEKPLPVSPAGMQALQLFGQSMGSLLEMFREQEESQFYAMQTAFMLLIAQMLSEQSDPDSILSLTLEQTVGLLNASGGCIWLLSPNGRSLELASSLTSSLLQPRAETQPVEQGLLGWVIANGACFSSNAPSENPHFDPAVDQVNGTSHYSIAAVPLQHRETIGVLAIFNIPPRPFGRQDTTLLEGIARLIASAITNAQLLQELRDYADQNRVLYEMSQELASGLELYSTYDQALGWSARLCEVEVGLLWLVDEKNDKLTLVAHQGVDLDETRRKVVAEKASLVSRAIEEGQALLLNEPASEPGYDKGFGPALGVAPHNMMILPMVYRGRTMGALNLINKIGRPFDTNDHNLLAMALEMVAIAISNAGLHNQTLALMSERERLHRQTIQSERLATIGRLTASLSHEINNPMQAIRGAMTLALEELDDPPALEDYIRLSLDQSDRVVRLVNRMRQIYRPQNDEPGRLDLNRLLQDAITVARKELNRQDVVLHTKLTPRLPAIWGIGSQLHLVFLNMILNLSDAIGLAGGGDLYLRSRLAETAVQIEFATLASAAPISNWVHIFEPDDAQKEVGFGLIFSRAIVRAHDGRLQLNQHDGQTVFRVEFPIEY